MDAKQVEQIVHMEPFKPYRVMLRTGEQVVVKRARKSHVSGPVLSLVGDVTKKPGGATVGDRFRIIPVDDIVSVEHVDLPIRGK